MAIHVLLLKNAKGVFPIEAFRLEVYLCEFTRHCVILFHFRVFLCSMKGRWYEGVTQERTFFRWFTEVRVSTRRMASRIGVSRMQVWRTIHEEDLYPYHDERVGCIILVQVCRGNALRRVASRLGMLVSCIVLGTLITTMT